MFITPAASTKIPHLGAKVGVHQDGFMEALHGILAPGGELRIKTDDQPYFMREFAVAYGRKPKELT